LPGDDDACGIVLRYLDERNFIRVTLCGAAGAGHPPLGLSVQQVVEGSWSELFRDDGLVVAPNPGSFHELEAMVVGNQLLVRVAPDGADASELGPFALDDRLGRGRIGLFSWGMSQTSFDWVRVHGFVPLRIADVRLIEDRLHFRVINQTRWPFDLESATALEPAAWEPELAGQVEAEVVVPVGSGQRYWRLRRTLAR
jgi:hypothetical protein